MRIYIKDMARARQAAKSLKLNLDDWHVEKPLTWHQETISMMLGHADWHALSASVEAGTPPSILDEDAEHEEVLRRRAFQAQVLIDRIGDEAAKRGIGHDILTKIARHVAPSGRPNSGTAFQSFEAEIGEHGIEVPFNLEFWTEDAIFFWNDLPVVRGYEHVAATFDPEAEELYAMFDGPFDSALAYRYTRFIESKPDDNLDKLALLARGARTSGLLSHANRIIGDAYNIGSYAWAPVCRERRRLHNPVRWWDETATRPFMRVLFEMAMIGMSTGTQSSINSGLSMFKAIKALNKSDPLKVIETIENVWGIPVIDKDSPPSARLRTRGEKSSARSRR